MALVMVSGALANKPFNGGNAWSRLSWVRGFQRLGFEVCFVEQIGRDGCVDAAGQTCPFHSSINLAYFREVMARFDLTNACSLIYRDGEEAYGLSLPQLSALANQATLLFNLSGHLGISDLKPKTACKVYYDDDPGYTQFWHAAQNPGARLWDHDFYFTLGANIGRPECPIPTSGIRWVPTRPPVVLDDWPTVPQPRLDRFTTVASWRGAYGPVHFNGVTYGLKVHEFRKFIELPQLAAIPFEIALQIHAADHKDLEALLRQRWRITDPRKVAGSVDDFRRFVQESAAEFSVAQGVYVATNSGWFSDRTVRYLASGKPVLIQDTGLNQIYPVGRGLLTFQTLEEAVAAVEELSANYTEHCVAARHLAEDFFDSDKIIRAVLREIGVAEP
ncbi:MAG TPA: hypothetical protein VL793_15700 [Patescibacteria group bacterium]|nr:hypothetical protein [Patescibacteria group bacterium]